MHPNTRACRDALAYAFVDMCVFGVDPARAIPKLHGEMQSIISRAGSFESVRRGYWLGIGFIPPSPPPPPPLPPPPPPPASPPATGALACMRVFQVSLCFWLNGRDEGTLPNTAEKLTPSSTITFNLHALQGGRAMT